MYQEHFGLRELPFSITPDTAFFFPDFSHEEALNTLLIATRTGEGFMKVVGEVGTGKTLLCRKFLGALDAEGFVSAYIPNPYVAPQALLFAVANELGVIGVATANSSLLLERLTKYLLQVSADGGRVVLCLDEVQAMPVETLEALRLLTNLETERRKLLQVVLFGQPELDVKLSDPAIRQLRQRITFTCRLRPLNAADVEYYVAHRMAVAGYRGPRAFTTGAVRRLARASGGVPRLINVLAHKALLAAFGEGVRAITERHVRRAVADTESVTLTRTFGARLKRYFAGLAGG